MTSFNLPPAFRLLLPTTRNKFVLNPRLVESFQVGISDKAYASIEPHWCFCGKDDLFCPRVFLGFESNSGAFDPFYSWHYFLLQPFGYLFRLTSIFFIWFQTNWIVQSARKVKTPPSTGVPTYKYHCSQTGIKPPTTFHPIIDDYLALYFQKTNFAICLPMQRIIAVTERFRDGGRNGRGVHCRAKVSGRSANPIYSWGSR